MNSVLVKIFSGAHRGAILELPEGSYTVGTDDSCDIILSDTSLTARHATFLVRSEQERTILLAEPLDGALTLDGSALTQETPLPPGQPFFLAQMCMAWSLPAEQTSAWQKVEDRLARRSGPEETAVQEQVSAPETEHTEAIPTPAEAPETSEPLALQKPVRRFPVKRVLSLLILVLLAGTLTLSWKKTEEKPAVETMKELLAQSGYTKLSVQGDGGSVTIRGRIASDGERGRLLRLARLMPFPVYLDVQVGSDAAEAVRASFNTLGLYPEVRELPPSRHPGLLILGYVRDAVLEEQALSLARKDVPELHEKDGKTAQLAVFREIRHAGDIQVLLEPLLASAGLNGIAVEYLPGKVALHGALTPQSRDALEDILTKVREKLGVPFPADIFNDAAWTPPGQDAGEPETAPVPRAESPAASPSMRFKISAVNSRGLHFITLDSGERVFEGGELPGGFVLESIGEDFLTLRKDQQTLNYPLRGVQ